MQNPSSADPLSKFSECPLDFVDETVRAKAARRFKERNIRLPTFAELQNPDLIPEDIKEQLKTVSIWDINPLNLYRITWKNDPVEKGGQFGKVNYIELPSEITGVKARIFVLIGKWFPTACHKVGASYGPLVSRITRGLFDPETQKALWPSTGNYCRGGALNCALMACQSIAVLPEEMSEERFNWLKDIGAEIYATPGCESNVREIFEKTEELVETNNGKVVAFNQFSDPANPLFHYTCTGDAIREIFEDYLPEDNLRLSGVFFLTGSAGTIAAGDYVKERYPSAKVIAGEALQCPTLLNNGFGGHRIEGVTDKHVPYVHNVRNTDVLCGIDDEDAMRVLRLFHSEEGKQYFINKGVDPKLVEQLSLFGISGVANLLGCIKSAKYFEMDETDCLFTVATDSGEMYQSRIAEMNAEFGPMSAVEAEMIHKVNVMSLKTDFVEELSYHARKRVHNLKFYTWVEQRGIDVSELDEQWTDREFFLKRWKLCDFYDERIREFNKLTGLAE